jgi:hypothetical protein
MKTEYIKLLNLEPSLVAANIHGATRREWEAAVRTSIEKLAEALKLVPTEVLYCFFSPHQAPKAFDHTFPRGIGYVIPTPGESFDTESVKVAFWIQDGEKIVGDSKCTTFFTLDGHAQIADDDWVNPNAFAEEMSLHLREGKCMNYWQSMPREYVREQILPLLSPIPT